MNGFRKSGAFDGVIDFDAVVRDPTDPTRMLPAYDKGDNPASERCRVQGNGGVYRSWIAGRGTMIRLAARLTLSRASAFPKSGVTDPG
jgi:hypothetical protein